MNVAAAIYAAIGVGALLFVACAIVLDWWRNR